MELFSPANVVYNETIKKIWFQRIKEEYSMRKIIAILLVLALSLGFSAAFADQTVTVSGSGEVLVPADVAVVSVGVNVRKADALEAQAAANEVIARIREALTAAGFDGENINTGYVSLWGVYDYNGETESVVAYNANSTLAVKVTDMARVGEAIDLAFGAGANTLDGVSFSVENDADARKEALKKAVADAKEKAAVLAEAAGLGEPEIKAIQEGGVSVYDNNINNFAVKAMGAEAAVTGRSTVVTSARIAISASVTIVFETK